jgi:hypothetical protein
MIEHTHDKAAWGVVIGRTVIFMARPEITRQKKYREPIVVDKKRYKNKAQAELAAMQWEGQLV